MTARMEKALADGHATFVTDTSVANGGGRGLYAVRAMNVGDQLPYPYPGITLSDVNYERLNSFLAELTSNPRRDARDILKQNWGITIVGKEEPDWDRIYDTFLAYGFSLPGNKMLVWCDYKTNGNINADKTEPRNAGVYFNEPPMYATFLNRLTMEPQASVPNVRAIDKRLRGGKYAKVFVATRPISPWDELLICYGPEYPRDYPINFGESGCGNADEVDMKLLTTSTRTLKRRGYPPDLIDRITRYHGNIRDNPPVTGHFEADSIKWAMKAEEVMNRIEPYEERAIRKKRARK